MQGDDRNDGFDDLFEPFELDDSPTAEQMSQQSPDLEVEPFEPQPEPPQADATVEGAVVQSHVTTSSDAADVVACPACGARNPSYNHHCERCGSRLSEDPMPIAPAPGSRSSAGGRALGVLAASVLLVALVALTINIFRSDAPEAAGPDTTSSSTTTTVPVPTIELFASQVTASSQVAQSFSPDNLIDGDDDSYWNDDSQRGVDAWIEFTFATPVQIREIELQNVMNDTKFRQNFKIQGYTITVSDLDVGISGRLSNSNQPQTVKIASLETIWLRIEVTTVHPAESVEDLPPFDELALQGVRFFGIEK